MAWVTCPHCGFTQIPAAQCLKCKKRLDRMRESDPAGASSPGGTPAAPAAPATAASPLPTLKTIPRVYLLGFAALALAIITGVLVWGSRSAVTPDLGPPPAATTPEPWSLDLTGRWQGKIATTIHGSPSRPALRELFVETDRSGNVVAAGVTLTDPGRGGAGAGYLTVPDGGRRVRELATALAASPSGASLTLDFIPYAPWVPQRDRTWRAVEGMRKTPEETTYLLLESRESDYLVQAGVNATGFLSYLYLSPAYASGRGTDALSKIIHPGPESSLRGFRNLIWDLSGSADFVTLQVSATISGPAGSPDRITLRRQ
jgi:hypothetical protein